MSEKEGELKKRIKYETGSHELGKIGEILDEAKQDFPKFGLKDISKDLDPVSALEKFRIEQTKAIYKWFEKWFGEAEK